MQVEIWLIATGGAITLVGTLATLLPMCQTMSTINTQYNHNMYRDRIKDSALAVFSILQTVSCIFAGLGLLFCGIGTVDESEDWLCALRGGAQSLARVFGFYSVGYRGIALYWEARRLRDLDACVTTRLQHTVSLKAWITSWFNSEFISSVVGVATIVHAMGMAIFWSLAGTASDQDGVAQGTCVLMGGIYTLLIELASVLFFGSFFVTMALQIDDALHFGTEVMSCLFLWTVSFACAGGVGFVYGDFAHFASGLATSVAALGATLCLLVRNRPRSQAYTTILTEDQAAKKLRKHAKTTKDKVRAFFEHLDETKITALCDFSADIMAAPFALLLSSVYSLHREYPGMSGDMRVRRVGVLFETFIRNDDQRSKTALKIDMTIGAKFAPDSVTQKYPHHDGFVVVIEELLAYAKDRVEGLIGADFIGSTHYHRWVVDSTRTS